MKYVILSAIVVATFSNCSSSQSDRNTNKTSSDEVDQSVLNGEDPSTDNVQYISTSSNQFKNKTAEELTEMVGFEINGGENLLYSGFVTLGKSKEKIGEDGKFEFSSPQLESKRGTGEMYTYRGTFNNDKLTDTCITSMIKFTDGKVSFNYSLTALYNKKGCQECTIEGVLISELGAMKDTMGHIENDTPNGYRDAFLLKWNDKAAEMQRKNRKKKNKK